MMCRIAVAALCVVLGTSPAAAQRAARTSGASRPAPSGINPFDPPPAARVLSSGTNPSLPTVEAPGEVTSTITGAAPVATLRDGTNHLTVVAPGDAIGPWRVEGIEEGGVRLALTVPGTPRERFLPLRRGGTASDAVLPGAAASTAPASAPVLPGEIPTLPLPPSPTVQPERPN